MSAADSPALDPAPPSRRCSGITGEGKACKAWAVRGGELCAGHAGLGLAANPQAAQQAAAASQRAQGERRRELAARAKMTTRERLGEVLEQLQEDVVAAFRTAMRTGSQDDLRKAQAAELLLSRVHGRPMQPTRDETPTVASSLADLEGMSLEELSALARDLPTDPEAA